jgi:hypothetical protein
LAADLFNTVFLPLILTRRSEQKTVACA